jgi:hypothetical protein
MLDACVERFDVKTFWFFFLVNNALLVGRRGRGPGRRHHWAVSGGAVNSKSRDTPSIPKKPDV